MGVSYILYVCILSVCTRSVWSDNGEYGHHGTPINPFVALKEKYYISTDNIGVGVLQTILNEFSTKFQCDPPAQSCGASRCFDATQIVSVFGASGTGVTEDVLNQISIVLLAAVSDLNTTCGQNVEVTAPLAQTMADNLKMMFMSDAAMGLEVSPIQTFLSGLRLKSGHYNETSQDDAMDHLIKTHCLGADTLFDQLALDVESAATANNLGHISSLIVLHVLNDSKVSRECRGLPRPNFFIKNTFDKYNADNMAITQEAFAEIREAVMKDTGSHGNEAHEHHRRRRKRAAHADHELYHNHAWWYNASPSLDTNMAHSIDHGGDVYAGMGKSTDKFASLQESTCLAADQYFAIFGVSGNITEQKFSEMTPALVQQKLSGNCGITKKTTTKKEKPTVAERYGYGSLCTAIICLTAIFAIFFIRCQDSEMYQHFLELFIGLAVGTLFTDSFFHLIPVAFGIHAHDHSEDGGDGGDQGITIDSYLWHALSVCGGLYLFYLVEKLLSLFGAQNIDDIERDKKYQIPNMLAVSEKDMIDSKDSNLDNSVSDDKTSEENITGKLKGVSSVVVMIIFGDAIHNFADGLALGAAFTSSTTLGISTSIAIFCHELPHELGDFAVLLKGGLSYSKALIWNMVSALTAMVGLYVGLLISTDDTVTAWILGPTAGLFIYISLVDMMPLMVRPPLRTNFTAFVLNNIGLLTGAALMFILSVFENDIKI